MSITFPTSQYQTPVGYQPQTQQKGNLRSQIQQDVQTLSADLQSGDVQGAQKSYADLQKILQSSGAIGAGSTPTSPASAKLGGGLNTVLSDFQTLGQALSSGDLAGAQKDFAQLQTDSTQQVNTAQTAGAARGPGGHHRHHHVDSDADQSTAATAPTTTGSNQSPAATSSQVQAYQTFSFQATYQSASASNSGNPSQGQSNAYQISEFQASYQSVGISALNTSTDPISLNQSPSSAYQFQFTSFQASYQNVNYLA